MTMTSCRSLSIVTLVLLGFLLFLISTHEVSAARSRLRSMTRMQAERVFTERVQAMKARAQSSGNVLRAGATRVDATLPVGVPLAGYNHGDRRVPKWPLPEPRDYTTFMMPSVGVLEPTFVRALVIDNGEEQVVFTTLDGIGADGSLGDLAYNIAVQQGFPIPHEKIIFSASHSHSGPGAVSPQLLWALAPATDLLVKSLQEQLASSIAGAMMEAYMSMEPVKIGLGISDLVGLTRNRRCKLSPFLECDSIDPNLGIVRVDRLNGEPLATVWNYATHGTCYGPDNMRCSGDIMGVASILVEKNVGGVALFINADAGDIDPTSEACHLAPTFNGSVLYSEAIARARASVPTSDQVSFTVKSQYFDFGKTNLNLTLERVGTDCDHGGPLDICAICKVLHCDANLHLGSDWIENRPRLTAIRWDIAGRKQVMVTLPGEPLLELGWQIRNDTLSLGFDATYLLGYSNSHMGYFATPNEYELGGYEGLLTFWGIDTAETLRGYVKQMAQSVL